MNPKLIQRFKSNNVSILDYSLLTSVSCDFRNLKGSASVRGSSSGLTCKNAVPTVTLTLMGLLQCVTMTILSKYVQCIFTYLVRQLPLDLPVLS